MPVIVGVTFSTARQIEYYESGQMQLGKGAAVVAHTARGLELGTVVDPPRSVEEQGSPRDLTPLLRRATERDLSRRGEMRGRETDAFHAAEEKIQQHGLPMKLLSVSSTLDGRRMVFYFSAEGRVDFRALVADLARHLKTRIELRQLGARDVSRLLSGYGRCGRALCCAVWMVNFQPVTMKMAKEQGLALIPEKLAGVCGRLRCCIRYEHDGYSVARKFLPRVGSTVETDKGPGKVVEHRVPRGTYIVSLAAGGQQEVVVPELSHWYTSDCRCDECVMRVEPEE
jgi:cell fate regulator YaaT (PSP1 superfamily)